MHTRDMISTYAAHGGAWPHLKRALVQEGMSEAFAAEFVSNWRVRLGRYGATHALAVYDQWLSSRDEREALAYMQMLTRFHDLNRSS